LTDPRRKQSDRDNTARSRDRHCSKTRRLEHERTLPLPKLQPAVIRIGLEKPIPFWNVKKRELAR
jgi:hypothetical protein